MADGWSLSPTSSSGVPDGLKLVLPSPHGSAIAFKARDRGVAVFCGGLRNRLAAALAYEAPGANRRATLADGASARELVERSFEKDVTLCLEEDVSDVASVLEDHCFVAWRPPRIPA